MKQLDFTLSLIDKLTRPLKQAQQSVTGFANKSKDAFKQIGVGAMAMWGVAETIKGALSPAIDMYDSLSEASARGIDSTALKTVRKDALLFSMTYGASAVDFVNSTAEINGAIAGLTSTELPKVTKVASTLAFAMKATSAETAEFMGQMFGNFRSEAERLGKVQFAEQLAGKMTFMRKTFGAEMGTIKDLMEGARGVGTNFNIGLDEQLAVLGQLSRTQGTEASSAYEGFMTGAIDGAKKLGLSFQDAGGTMLSMPAMLEKLQGKYGKSLEGNLKAQKELDDAFGDSAAVVKQLYGNVDLLRRNITDLGGSDGLKRTQEMAAKMVKPWDRFIAILKAIQTVIGLTLIPVLYPLLNRLAEMGATFAKWMEMFPNIARVVGYVTLAVLGFAAMGAALNIIIGVSSFVMTGWGVVLGGLRGVLMAVRIASMLTGAAINFMSWPVLLIIAAIALLAVGCYMLIRHWDAVKNAVMNTTAFKLAEQYITWLAGVYSAAWEFISEGWNKFTALLSGFSPLETLGNMASGIVTLFDNVWDTIKGAFLKSWDWIVGKLNKIPGVNISLAGDNKDIPVTQNTLSTGGQLTGIDKGGISKTITSSANNVTDRSQKIGTLNITTQQPLTPGQLAEWQELHS